jgi:predicted DNA-binding ribbon-helix-helix protein
VEKISGRGIPLARAIPLPEIRSLDAREFRPSLKGRVEVLRKRSFSIAGHRTSVALEPEFWTALEAHARSRKLSLAGLVAQIDAIRGERPLASALRVHALAPTLPRP